MLPVTSPRLALTLGDVAGVGPEVVVRSLIQQASQEWHSVIVGCPVVVRRAIQLIGADCEVVSVGSPGEDWYRPGRLVVWNPSKSDVSNLPAGVADGRAGQAAYDWLVASTRSALAGEIDSIVTAPLSKLGCTKRGSTSPVTPRSWLRKCGVAEVAMMLYLPPGEPLAAGHSLSIAHATLHTSIASVPKLLTTERVHETIELIDHFLKRIGEPARIGVCALNPHAGEDGLFGDEEARVIAPAIERAREQGIDATGPKPADTLIKSAVEGAFHGIVACIMIRGISHSS